MICAVVLLSAFVLAAPPTGRASASPSTWAALQATLPSDGGARAKALLRFAHDDDPPLADRIKAAKAAQAALAATDGKRIDTSLLLATLHGIAGKTKERRAALVAARTLAKKKGLEKGRRIDEAINGEDALAVLVKALGKRGKLAPGTPSGELETKAAGVVEGTLPAWLAIGDERQHGLARIALAERLRLDGDAAKAERTLSDAVDALANERDTAGVRAEAWRALSRLFVTSGRWDEAASAALASDRAAADDPRRHPLVASEGPRYVRSADTARLCKEARNNGVSCAKIEKQRWGDRTYFDFTAWAAASSARAPFDAARADDVLAEYESELHECLKQGAKANLTNDTHVEMVWTVGNDGRVPPTAEINPLRLRGTVVESCVRKAFTLFRYPPYAGELQHVRLGFDVGS
jgi:hypothetical protein